jgi:hypothetical protein
MHAAIQFQQLNHDVNPQADPKLIADAVALHEASDATVLVVGDSTASSAGFSKESCGEGADRSGLDLYVVLP